MIITNNHGLMLIREIRKLARRKQAGSLFVHDAQALVDVLDDVTSELVAQRAEMGQAGLHTNARRLGHVISTLRYTGAPERTPPLADEFRDMDARHDAERKAEEWTREYGDRSCAEGWSLFAVGTGIFQIQADTDYDIFETDADAEWHVIQRAGTDPMYAQALALHLQGQHITNRNG